MYTATITNKEFINGGIKVTVDFSDGVTTVTESCIPQDKDGFKYWVKSRLATFNGGQEVDSLYSLNEIVDVSEPVVEEPVLTQAEIDRNEWILDYRKWVKVKSTLIDTGILTGDEPQVLALKSQVQASFRPAYLSYI